MIRGISRPFGGTFMYFQGIKQRTSWKITRLDRFINFSHNKTSQLFEFLWQFFLFDCSDLPLRQSWTWWPWAARSGRPWTSSPSRRASMWCQAWQGEIPDRYVFVNSRKNWFLGCREDLVLQFLVFLRIFLVGKDFEKKQLSFSKVVVN